jgi:hypothetical protein
MFISKLLSRNTKKKLHIPQLSCTDMKFGPKYLEKYMGLCSTQILVYTSRGKTHLSILYNSPNLHDFLGSKRLNWAGHLWRAEGRLIRLVFVNKLNKK